MKKERFDRTAKKTESNKCGSEKQKTTFIKLNKINIIIKIVKSKIMENHLKLVQHLLTDKTTNNEEKINLIKEHFSEERIKEVDDLIEFAENVKCDIENGHFDHNIDLVAKDYYLRILSINESNISFF